MSYTRYVNKGIVLAIDDMPERYVKLGDMLRSVGLVMVCVQNPVSANTIIGSGCVCAILLDHDMPHWDGQYYAREVVSLTNLPICISSANPWGSDKIKDILIDLGMTPTKIAATHINAPNLWYNWVLKTVFHL
jgi:CheY-like chemotaxis protein